MHLDRFYGLFFNCQWQFSISRFKPNTVVTSDARDASQMINCCLVVTVNRCAILISFSSTIYNSAKTAVFFFFCQLSLHFILFVSFSSKEFDQKFSIRRNITYVYILLYNIELTITNGKTADFDANSYFRECTKIFYKCIKIQNTNLLYRGLHVIFSS